MIYKKTNNPNTLENIIKNIGGQYNTLMLSFQNLYEDFRTRVGELELLKNQLEEEKEKKKKLIKEISRCYSELSKMKKSRDRGIFDFYEEEIKNIFKKDPKQMELFSIEKQFEKISNEDLIELTEFDSFD